MSCISIIVAVAKNNVIGKDNQLIWHLPADMKFFKEKTSGHTIITGRKNYESIPEKFRPLPNRVNIVITRQNDYNAPGAIVVNSLEQAIEKAKQNNDNEIFIIGGAQIYAQSLDLVDKMYVTKIDHEFEGDAFFSEIDYSKWKIVLEIKHTADEKNKYDFTIFELFKI
ncbi:MAG: dihydrofolate reductase [Bacteroidota bacterium]